MLGFRVSGGLAVLTCLISAPTATAAPIILSADRFVTGYTDFTSFESEGTTSTSGPFSGFVSAEYFEEGESSYQALLQSVLSPLFMGGSGVVESRVIVNFLSNIPQGALAQSSFASAFTLDSYYDVAIAGSLFALGDGQGALVSLRALETGTTVYEQVFSSTGHPGLPVLFSGTLAPGAYDFRLLAATEFFSTGSPNAAGGSASFDVNLTLTPTPIPEPASLTLLAVGLTGLIAGRRKRSGRG